LTLSSIFLCGIVVIYVANADDYRQKYNALRDDRDGLSKKVEGLTKQLNEKIAQSKQREDELTGQIASDKAESEKIKTALDNTEREKAALLDKVNSWTSITEAFYQTNDKQGQLLKNTLEELNKAQAEQIKERKELSETSQALVEKMAIIETLETEKKRLVEEKTELQNRSDQALQPAGKVAAAPVPVTQPKDTARPAQQTQAKNISLKALVSSVDLKNSMAGISIGSADGVKEGMKFHVTRGDEFLCDILIIDVDTDKAVGILDLVQQQPKVGDTASTNL